MKLTTLLKFASTGIFAVALSVVVAKAGPITGSIDFYSTTAPKTDTGNLTTAEAFTKITNVFVQNGPTGSYSGLAGDSVTFSTPLSFTQTGDHLLWTLNTGAGIFTFDETSIVVTRGNFGSTQFLNIAGTGDAFWNGTDESSGTWSITDTTTGSAGFTFSASTTVPDTGATALLIGLGIAAIGFGLYAQKRQSLLA